MAPSTHVGAHRLGSFRRASKLTLLLIGLCGAAVEQSQQEGAEAAPRGSLRGAGADSSAHEASATSGKMAAASQVVVKALQLGDANGQQVREIMAASRRCFGLHRVDTSNVGTLQGTLGSAVGCVEGELKKAWGSRPSIGNYGSHSCGQCEGYGLGSTVIEVETEAGDWIFVLRLEGAAPETPAQPSHPVQGHAVVIQKGDATDEQLEVILRATNSCFKQHEVDTSNIGALQGSLGSAVGCVEKACERAWGFKPRVSGYGSHACGHDCGAAYGLGATIIAFDGAASGDWMFQMRLK